MLEKSINKLRDTRTFFNLTCLPHLSPDENLDFFLTHVDYDNPHQIITQSSKYNSSNTIPSIVSILDLIIKLRVDVQASNNSCILHQRS